MEERHDCLRKFCSLKGHHHSDYEAFFCQNSAKIMIDSSRCSQNTKMKILNNLLKEEQIEIILFLNSFSKTLRKNLKKFPNLFKRHNEVVA